MLSLRLCGLSWRGGGEKHMVAVFLLGTIDACRYEVKLADQIDLHG